MVTTFRTITVALLLSSLLAVISCKGSLRQRERHFEFGQLTAADRIVIIGRGGRLATVTEPDRLQAAIRYMQRHQDGWTEALVGPTAGEVELRFYKGQDYIDEVQLGRTHLVYGSYHLNVPPAEIEQLARTLDVVSPLQ